MDTPNWLAAVSRVVLIAALPLLLIATPLYVFVSPVFIRHEYGLRDFPPSERFNDAERLRLSDVIVNYLRNRATENDMATMRTDGGEVAMRPEEVQHIVDVKVVTDGFFLVHKAAALFAALSAYFLWRSPRRRKLGAYLRQGVWITAGFIGLVVLFSLVDFDTFFTQFHQVFFQPDTWIFYVEDTLIQLYPLPLWVDAVWKLGVTILIEAGLLYLAAAWLDRKTRLIERDEMP